jgi:hypothetical protein
LLPAMCCTSRTVLTSASPCWRTIRYC